MTASNTQKNREKTIRLVEFLQRLADLRARLIRDIEDYEKVLWISSVPRDSSCWTQAWVCDEEQELDAWLEVNNRREPEFPEIPDKCRKLVDPKKLREKNKEHPPLPPEVQKIWDRYISEKWEPWKEAHDAWEKVHKVYSTLFAMHQEQLRLDEEYELVLGLGLLTWLTPNGHKVRRHLVVANANLEFEAKMGKFTVRSPEDGAKLRLELDMLDISSLPGSVEESAKEELAKADDNPWDKRCIDGVLRKLVHSIDPEGRYSDSLDLNDDCVSQKPVVQYAPALILRKRSAKGLTETLKRIKEQIENGQDIPSAFGDLAEIRTKDDIETPNQSDRVNVAFNGEIFFPRFSNEEQRRIIEKLGTGTGVLVQGPPGTGKSHTIANLICHLLATGQRILITAKTPRALQVLNGLVPDELRPLCITLLGSGREERRSLESSVNGIIRKINERNDDQNRDEREKLETSLEKLREEKTQVERRLRDIRESETRQHSIVNGAYKGTAARIAEAVNRNRAYYGWLTDSVPLDGPCQISKDDLQVVLDALRYYTPDKRRELRLSWPKKLPSPDEFSILVKEEISAAEEEQRAVNGIDEHYVDLLASKGVSVIDTVRDAFSSFWNMYRGLSAKNYSWMKCALSDILSGESRVWRERLSVTSKTITAIEPFVAIADGTSIEFPKTTDIRTLCTDAQKLQEYMKHGGKLGWWIFRPRQVKERLYVIKTVRINGHPCSTTGDFSNLAKVLYVRIMCEEAWKVWRFRCEDPYKHQLDILKSWRDALNEALVLENSIAACRKALKQCPGIGEPVWGEEAQIERIISSCRLAAARLRKCRATEAIRNIEEPISKIAGRDNAHPVTKELLNAVHNRDVDMFARNVNMINSLEYQHNTIRIIDNETLPKLRELLPRFTRDLEQTVQNPDWDERIKQLDDAWRWAQARRWIEEYIRKEDVPALDQRAKQIEEEINSIIAQLAALYGWSLFFSRIKDDHRRHMEAWQQSMRKFGKGTGKHALRHQREAQEHLNKCREAIPAWIMPLHRVWDTVAPAPGMFDVIIVDEASQCGMEALPLLYLGKKILIVGDDKQISPDAVGVPREHVHKLVRQFLYDFQFQSSFDVESSLFDHGKILYGTQRITLREHFRCMPEIIRFSNELCYSDTPLIPLRQYGPNRLPPLEHVFVEGGYRKGSGSLVINRPEAEAIARRIVDMCGNNRYKGKTMGVVVLQGEAQATLIESLLLEKLGAEEMERRCLICGNPYSFQGDERDIILLSLVAAPNEKIGPLTKPADERRFNVAASRARDQMILFHSVKSEDLSEHDLRLKLLEFFEETKPVSIAGIELDELERRAAQDNRGVVKPPSPFESWFELDVALELLRKKYIVLAQHEVAGKRIDLVVEGGQARMAVECDGDHWHGADRYVADMQRQRQLERCGWEFFRVKESVFYADKNTALQSLWSKLEERGIFPGSKG